MKIYGYARISTAKQSLERQIHNIKEQYPTAIIITEKYTGTSMNRTEWNKLYKKLTANDTVVFDSVSRMSRDATEGFVYYEELYNKGVNLVFLKEPHINTEVYKKALTGQIELTGHDVDCILKGVNQYLLILAKEQIRLAFWQAEKEVEDLRQRTREGIREVKNNNEKIRLGVVEGEIKKIGQETGVKLTTKKSIKAKEEIKKYSKDFAGTLDDKEVIKLTGISRNSYYKYKRELKAE